MSLIAFEMKTLICRSRNISYYTTKQQLYCHIPHISQTIQVTGVDSPVKTFIFFYVDTGCSLEDLLRVMTDKNRGWEFIVSPHVDYF